MNRTARTNSSSSSRPRTEKGSAARTDKGSTGAGAARGNRARAQGTGAGTGSGNPSAPSRAARNGAAKNGSPKNGAAKNGAAKNGAAKNGSSQNGRSRRGGGRPPVATGGEFALPVTVTPALPAVEAFDELELPARLLETLHTEGVTSPFPIQAATLPNSLAGRDVLGRGRTGSGKTLAFGLAMLARTSGQRAEPRQPLALVLVPTRELAQQVTDALTPYARALRLRLATVVGGMSIGRQASALRGGAEVVVATPGRLKDLIDRDDCRLDRVAITVLDEADQMADMGFMPQVTALLDQVRPDGQRLLFSATLDRNVDRLVRDYLHDPVVHSVDPSAGAVTTMDHHVLHVEDDDKHATTTEIAAREGRVIMFLDSKHATDRLVKKLLAVGVRAAALHGGKSQSQRNRALSQFKDGDVTALVATNVAARGIHVDDLDLVVNVDPPGDHKDYLHRGGRTARAGESGTVVTLVLPHQRRDVTQLMAVAGITPTTTRVRSGDADLNRITGAQAPSGVPVVLAPPVTAQPAARPSSTSRGRRSRPAQGRRRAPAKGNGR
ncbi:DEAD/DEAH box helicase [Streptomyces europaeiscabiei]|uniref:DEAD/DEAH box helicase n=3 Tax=Streptomyces europaeiscabiei TaxID=146819 RepID=A0ABU4NLH4_9ACTN|nr:DEAD/DEAH box helicase [Streptomyces europaeiscabiei]MDX3546142.1 DEAD/DEAH box helicase [Streptomyces europaeiscabiei]MDX3557552.1 DEAD/DEAH box helicase [Streptomyces europaeiscabiei]MDX3668031.1 DEAD/DEAH box helicase [Streptomyces europaeiscabiei]MDX3703541.1 DEAD/DEAH box helicase [Streptomyces europaeiscabiei]MDX3831111.1 DEAD/DEAH box helicase [Streptomyces europaeiscabiei]